MSYKHRNIAKTNRKRRNNDEYVFMFKTIKEVEEILGYGVNEAFKMGWDTARMMVRKNKETSK